MGKGSDRRKCLVSKEEEDFRWKLAYGKITREVFNEVMAIIKKEKENEDSRN